MTHLPRDPRCPIGWGNASGYRNKRCRCQYCGAAHAENVLRRTYERAAEADGEHPFGKPFSASTYFNYRCRCDLCRAARMRRERERRADEVAS